MGQFNTSQAGGADLGNSLLSVANTALGFVPGGAAFQGALTGITALFSKYGPKTDEAKQSADINKIAAANGITGTEAATVVAYHANHSSDHFNDLAAYVANEQPSRFDSLLAEYNGSNPPQRITLGSIQRAADQVAQAQQKMITTALTTSNFAESATGQQFVSALQQLPAQQVVGTQQQTVGDILQKILDGAVKGGGDAAAETAWGKKFKWSYIQDWLKENQLLAFFLAIIAGLGLLTVVNIARGKHGKISF
ncbi:MAG: hypothetical protein ACRYFX_12705 [Janthinobacterium lividum]